MRDACNQQKDRQNGRACRVCRLFYFAFSGFDYAVALVFPLSWAMAGDGFLKCGGVQGLKSPGFGR